MTNWTADVPVAIFIFNRPEPTKRVFRQIAEVEPSILYVVADGPRFGVPTDPDRCRVARSITEQVDWDCEVHREYADENLGLKQRFVTGLKSIFETEQQAIILEDDCIPNQDFFRFCETMLRRYADDERIWDVAGTNYLERWRDNQQDYHFSNQGGIWGWATWRRSWEDYDPEMELWTDTHVRSRLRDVIADGSQYEYLRTVYRRAYRNEIETWDYPWGFARNINSGLSVVPSRNLVSNIGFGSDATNTTENEGPLSAIPRHPMSFPIEFKEYVAVDREFDDRFHHLRTSWWERVSALRRLTDDILRRWK